MTDRGEQDIATAQCGRAPKVSHGGSRAAMVDIVQAPSGRVDVQGMRQCNSVWACPVCSARIAAQRAEEIATGVREAVRKGWGVAMVTLTLDHRRTDDLADLWDILNDAWRQVQCDPAWRKWQKRHGVDLGGKSLRVPLIRLTEVTVGEKTGWHPHLHLLMFTEKGETRAETEALHAEMMKVLLKRFQARLKVLGHRCIDPEPGKPRSGGWTCETVQDDTDEALGRYFSKVLYVGLGMEVASAPTKQAKEGRMTPMQLLARLASGEMGVGYWQRRAWWSEWCQTSLGRRQIVWSPGLKSALGVAEVSDEDCDDSWDAPPVSDNAHSRTVVYGPKLLIKSVEWRVMRSWQESGQWPAIVASLEHDRRTADAILEYPDAWRLWPAVPLPPRPAAPPAP